MRELPFAALVAAAAIAAGCGSASAEVTVAAGGSADAGEPATSEAGDADEGSVDAEESAGQPTFVVGEDACEADEDCVPAECCHPRTCVARANAPDCEGSMCTMDCRARTMDCGAGSCVCHEGRCAAKMNPPRKIRVKGRAPARPASTEKLERRPPEEGEGVPE